MKRTFRLRNRSMLLVGGANLLLCLTASSIGADPLGTLLNSDELRRLHSGPAVNHSDAPRGISENGEYWGLFKDPGNCGKTLFDWLGDPGRNYKLGERRALLTDDFVGVRGNYEDSDGRSYAMQILIPHPKRFVAADVGLIKEFREIGETAFGPDAVDTVQIGKLSGTLLTRMTGQCLLKIALERHSWFTVSLSEKCDDPSSLTQFARKLFLDRVNLKLKL